MNLKIMKIICLAAVILLSACGNKEEPETITGTKGEVFFKRVAADKLSDAWEITYGPDNFLWITEAKGYRVSRINPANGTKKVLLDLNNAKNFPRYDQVKSGKDEGKPWPQGGLMGLALHPQLLSDKPYVYLSYVYNFSGANAEGKGCAEKFGGCFYTTRIVRYRYEAKTDTLTDPEIICDTVPGSSDHNGGRLLVAPADGRDFLFYSIGEMGAGQFDNGGRPNHAQEVNYYQGKILRFNTDADKDTGTYDKWIPNDNPFNAVRQNAVWSFGHRNPQGLVYSKEYGKLYEVEHGPFSDDEVNIIEKGKNYGHPLIIGYNDGNYNSLAAAASEHKELPGIWHTAYPTIGSEQDNANAIGPDKYRNPIKSLYPTANTALKDILNKTRDGKKADWISEAPSSVDIYTSPTIPGWKNSLLIPALKTGQLIRLQLNASGDGIAGDTINYFKDVARYRDIAISADGSKIYIAIDSSLKSSGPTQGKKKRSSCRGCIVEFTYKGQSAQANK